MGKNKSTTNSGGTATMPSGILEVPLGDANPEHYCQRQLHVVPLNQEQALAMRRMREGLKSTHTQLENGRHVETSADVVRWVLEQISAQ